MQTLQNPTLATLVNATRPYTMQVEGSVLSPRYQPGQVVTISPAVNADPATIAPRSLVLAIAATDPAQPRRFSRPTLFTLNADRDLITAAGTRACGSYIVLGIVQEGAPVNRVCPKSGDKAAQTAKKRRTDNKTKKR